MTMPSAGWYPDPDNAAISRWWNGIAWTDNRTYAQPAAPQAPAAMTPTLMAPAATAPTAPITQPGYSASTPPVAPPGYYASTPTSATPGYYTGAPTAAQPGYSMGTAALRAPAGTLWSTPWIWMLVVLPQLASFTSIALMSTSGGLGSGATDYNNPGSFTSFIPFLIGVTAYFIGVWIAYLDFRELQQRGVPRPFHWAWAFLNTWAVYTIGRSVVVKKRTGAGLSPIWVVIALYVTTFVVALVVAFYLVLSDPYLIDQPSGYLAAVLS